jgi:hypothetical protein
LQIVKEKPARTTPGKVKLEAAPFVFTDITVVVKHEIRFVFLAGSCQPCTGFHIPSP